MSSRGSSCRKQHHQNHHHQNSEDQLICINLTGLDGLVHNDSEASVYSQGSEEEDCDRTEEVEDRYRGGGSRHHRSEHRGQKWSDRSTRPPHSKYETPHNKYETAHSTVHCQQQPHKYETAQPPVHSYYPQRGGEMSPQHVHTHGPSHHHHHAPTPPPLPETYQKSYQSAAIVETGECMNMAVVAPAHTAVAQPLQPQPPASPHAMTQPAASPHTMTQLTPSPQPMESGNPVRHYSLNVTACTLGLEKLDAQFERKRSIIEIRFNCSLKTNEDKYPEDIENIARTIKSETEKCLQTCLPPGENRAGGNHYGGGGNQNGGCFPTTMLMKPAAAKEFAKRGTMPAWVKQG